MSMSHTPTAAPPKPRGCRAGATPTLQLGCWRELLGRVGCRLSAKQCPHQS